MFMLFLLIALSASLFLSFCLFFWGSNKELLLVPAHLKGMVIWVDAERKEKIERMLFVGFQRVRSGGVWVVLSSRRGASYKVSLREIIPIEGEVNPLLSLVPGNESLLKFVERACRR